MSFALAPVGQGHVIVDADQVDGGMGPQRIKVEIDVVAGVIAEIFGPVGGVGDLGGWPQNAADIGGKLAQGGDVGESVSGGADLRQAAQLRTDAECIHPACGRAKLGIMQHKAAIAPVGGAGIADGCSGGGEMRGLGCAEEGGNLGRGGGGAVGGACAACGFGKGDAPAPWQMGLGSGIGPRIGQRVAR